MLDAVSPKADFARTEVGKVDLSGSANLPKPSEIVKNAPNGEQNFQATTHILTPDGTGSATLIAPNLLLTVAHNFLTVNGSKVVTKQGKKIQFIRLRYQMELLSIFLMKRLLIGTSRVCFWL